MDRTATRRYESAIALLAFLWGVQFALLVLLFYNGLWIDDQYRLYCTMGPAHVLSAASFVCGALAGTYVLAHRSWRRVSRVRHLDVAFAFLALLSVSPITFFGAASESWKAGLAFLLAGFPLALAYLIFRVFPSMRGRQPGEDEFP